MASPSELVAWLGAARSDVGVWASGTSCRAYEPALSVNLDCGGVMAGQICDRGAD